MFTQNHQLDLPEPPSYLKERLIKLNEFRKLEKKYASYKKIMSIAQIAKYGLPILPGYVVNEFSDTVLDFLKDWAHKQGAIRLSLRFDSILPQDNIRLMGASPSLEELSTMAELVHPPIVAIVQAEDDRFGQNYSVVTAFLTETMICEILGAGFDAGDLTRGLITPHERIILGRKNIMVDLHREIHLSDIISHTICSAKEYAESLKWRYSKIYSIITTGGGRFVKGKEIIEEQIKEVDKLLEIRHVSLPTAYTPLGFDKLSELYNYLSDLDVFHHDDVTGKSLAASFSKRWGLIFWDLYGSDKYRKVRPI